ncbi:MAG TPA: hypothetical protein VMP89_09635 [Solirubrobacteraceae bacterium]|nr:hypothetical protein [Solirubrobacteraceae bacterium]
MRFTKLTSSALPASILSVALLAGCGGSSTLSHAQLVTRADAACRQANQAAARLTAPGDSYAALAQYATQLSPIVQRLTGQLGALNASATDRPALQRYLGALRAGDRGLALVARASSPSQVSQASSLVTSQSIPAVAGALGASTCAQSVPSS